MRSNHHGLVHSTAAAAAQLHELTTFRLMRLVDFLNQGESQAFPRISGLSDFEWRVLALVCESPRLSNNEISDVVHRGVAQVSRTVTKLVAAGLMHRVNRKGGPGVLISTTRLGRIVYRPLKSLARQRDAAIIAGLNSMQIDELHRCIGMMTANAVSKLGHEFRRNRTKRAGEQ